MSEVRYIKDAANGSELAAEQHQRFDTVETEVRAPNDQIGRAERLAALSVSAARFH